MIRCINNVSNVEETVNVILVCTLYSVKYMLIITVFLKIVW